ncbi:MAG: hypothetical protein IIA67_08635 [Planctomycetes bacterium]|nr:hypothetical protein [Planctomycetota bacterium]
MRKRSMALAGAVAVLAICCGGRQGWAQPRGGPGSMFARLDANGNGLIEPSEVPDRFRPIFERMTQRAGLDPRRPIKIDRLREAMERNRPSFGGDRGRDRGRRDWGRRNNDRRRDDERRRDEERRKQEKKDEAGIPGFGVEPEELPPVLGFGAAFDTEGDDAMLRKKYSEALLREVDKLMDRYDKNNNGVLDPAEWKGVRWRSDPRASDINGDGRLTRAEFTHRIAGFWGKRALRDHRNSSRSSSSSPYALRSSSSRSLSDSGRSSFSSQSNREKHRKLAESVMNRYDKNKNRVLDRDEVGKWSRADKNGNGQVTMDELIGWLSAYPTSGSSSSGRSSGPSSRRTADTSRQFYRYRSPHERLPSGLPGWFKEKDKNADGQVAMAEYATNWSNETIDEFNGYDHNGDGMITPAEALKPRVEKPPSAYGQRSGDKSRGDGRSGYGGSRGGGRSGGDRSRGDRYGRRGRR